MGKHSIKKQGLISVLKGDVSTGWGIENAAIGRMITALKDMGDTLQAVDQINDETPSGESDPQSILLIAVSDLNGKLNMIAEALSQILERLAQREQGKSASADADSRSPTELKAIADLHESTVGMARAIRKAVRLANESEVGGEEHQQALLSQAIQTMQDKIGAIVDALAQLSKELETSENIDLATGKSALFQRRGCN